MYFLEENEWVEANPRVLGVTAMRPQHSDALQIYFLKMLRSKKYIKFQLLHHTSGGIKTVDLVSVLKNIPKSIALEGRKYFDFLKYDLNSAYIYEFPERTS